MLEKLKKLPEEWRKRTPKQKWQIIYRIGETLSELLGIKTYGDMQNYWFTYFGLYGAVVYLLTVLYTIWLYSERGEFVNGLKCTCSCGVAISVRQIF